MKLYPFLFLIFISISYSTAYTQNIKPEKKSNYALLIGIGSYPPESNWEPLHGDADVQLVKSTLLKVGFPRQNISSLINEEATKRNILLAFESLKKQISQKSIVHIHFSGHGQQVQDKNSDEIDGYDEAFVPFDSPKNYKPKINVGQNLIADDQLDSLISDIRHLIGSEGQLLVTMDACHSGTITRGRNIGRGTDVIMADEAYIQSHRSFKSDSSGILIRSTESNSGLAPFISIASSSPNEKSYEFLNESTQLYGLFTFFLCKNLLTNKACLSYNELYHHIASNVSAYTGLQHPQIEGPTEYCVFNNQLTQNSKFIHVKDIISTNMVLIDKGILHQIYDGSEILFYAESVRDPTGKAYLAKGIVDESSALDADVILYDNIPAETLRNAKAVVSKIQYGRDKMRLQFALKDTLLSSRMKEVLSSLNVFQVVDENPDLYFENPEGFANSDYMTIYDRNESLIYQKQINSTNEQTEIENIKSLLVKYQKAQQLIKLELPDEQLIADFSLNYKGKSIELREHNLNLSLSDTISFTLKNSGPQNFYFSILEIRPDFNIHRIFPEQTKTSGDYYLTSGNTYQSQSFKLIPPKGTYVLKLLLSTNPIDFNSLDASRSMNRTNHHELGNWIKQISNQPEVSKQTEKAQNSFGIFTNDALKIDTYYVNIQ